MAGKGGKRVGAGRKSLAEEVNSQQMAISALVSKFGSKEAAFTYLLGTEEPALIKFVYEHAFGKPQDKIEHSGEVTQNIVGMIIK